MVAPPAWRVPGLGRGVRGEGTHPGCRRNVPGGCRCSTGGESVGGTPRRGSSSLPPSTALQLLCQVGGNESTAQAGGHSVTPPSYTRVPKRCLLLLHTPTPAPHRGSSPPPPKPPKTHQPHGLSLWGSRSPPAAALTWEWAQAVDPGLLSPPAVQNPPGRTVPAMLRRHRLRAAVTETDEPPVPSHLIAG